MPGQTTIAHLGDAVLRVVALAATVVAIAATSTTAASAAPTTLVDLGAATSFAVLSGASVGNTVSGVGAPHTTIRGDLGVLANTAPTGFPPGIVTGQVQVATPAAVDAHAALVTAYAAIAARSGGAPLAGALAGVTVGPGLHTIAGAVSNTTTLTLDAGGDSNAVFVFQVNGALDMAAGSRVVLAGGARASRVFWQVNGAGSIGANAQFVGTLIASAAVAVGNGTLVNGRAFARDGALTLDANEFYSNPPMVTINGGGAAMTTDTTPTISGTTDLVAPAQVSVSIHGQTLLATPTAGAWSVTSDLLANASYAVVASVVDGAGNTGSAAQTLTVDTVLPIVTFAADSAVTSDATPTISGTTDVAAGQLVRVTTGASLMYAVVQAGGWWNITPLPLADGTHVIEASVLDPAGNPGLATRTVTIDTVAPALSVDGGAQALTNDATPLLSGSALGAAGQQVELMLADETLSALVEADGSWSAVASSLTDGPHRVLVRVLDAAGNVSSATQVLTIDTVRPDITITDGDSRFTDDPTPTVTGATDAVTGSTITVAVAGRSYSTVPQADGSWNVTPSAAFDGEWTIVASVTDAAGNVGSARQVLTRAQLKAVVTPTAVVIPAAAIVKVGVVTKVTVNQASKVTSRLTITARAAKQIGLLPKRSRSTKPVVVGTSSARTEIATTLTLRSLLTLKARGAFARTKLAVAVTQTITTVTADSTTATKRVIKVRPSRRS